MGIWRRAVVVGSIFLVVVLFVLRVDAAYVPPSIAGHVTDAAGKLTPAEVATLNQKLADYRTCSSNHVAVFFPRTLDGFTIEDVAYSTFNTWKIGEAKKDNGVLLVLAPNERKIRIETGKGVGGQLTDLESAHILRDVVGPNMKADRFFAAADQGTAAIGKALGGCTMAAPTSTPLEGGLWMRALFVGLIAVGAFVALVASRVRAWISALVVLAISSFLFWWTSGLPGVSAMLDRLIIPLIFSTFGAFVALGIRQARGAKGRRGGGGSYESSSGSSWSDSGGGGGGSDYSGGGGSSGGGGASDSY